MDEIVRKKHVREPPSVPFLWEVKPGIPKKDWKPEVSLVSHFPKTPLKLIASVPFVWEEKPGIPLPNYFPNVSSDSVASKPQEMLIHVASSSAYSVDLNYGNDDINNESSSDNVHLDVNYSDDSESIISSMGHEACSIDTYESFSSVPSLLANCLVPSAKVSTAIPLHKNSLSKHNCDQLQTTFSPASSETDSSTSSHATGMSSPVGASFLEYLFPFYPPKRDEHLENVSSTPNILNHEDNNSDMARRPPTLGELIMMSRRRSYRRKAVQMRNWDQPKVITQYPFFSL